MKRGILILGAVVSICGCDTVSEVVGAVGVAKEAAEHLETDIKAPLTDARIDKVVEVTPALKEFSKEAKVKWEPDPNANDFSNLAKTVTGLNEYVSFFESHDTRLTQFYVDFVKINDARSKIMFQRGQAESKAKLEAEKKELKQKLADADDKQKKKLERKLKRVELTLEKLSSKSKEAEEMRNANAKAGYVLSDEEMKLVENRIDELNKLFDKNKKKKQDE